MSKTAGLRVLIGTDDATPWVEEGLSFNSIDPGGCGTAQIPLPRDGGIKRGQRVQITAGLDTTFDGRVQRVGRTLAGAGGVNVSCEGAGARFKDVLVQEIWADMDLGRWGPPSVGRQLALLDSGYAYPLETGATVGPDASDGLPSLTQQLTRIDASSTANRFAACEALYASPVPLGEVYYDQSQYDKGGGGGQLAAANWHVILGSANSDGLAGATSTGDLAGTASAGYYTVPFGDHVVAFVQLRWETGNLTTDGEWRVDWRGLTPYGRHGLPRRGPDPGGFYPSDIFRDVLRRVTGVNPGVIEEASAFIVPHAVALDPVQAEQIALQQALLAGGWHMGTWPNPSILGDTPVADFRALPATATCHTPRADLDQLELEEDLSRLYNRALVTYTDGDGTTRTIERTRHVPELDEIGPRTLPVPMGQATAGSAATYADFLLALSERAARASGSAQTTLPVRLAGGGPKPAYLLRAGIDKVKIPDLPGLPLFAQGRDEFHLKQVDAVAGRDGLKTTLQFGMGADLLEVMNARIQLATEVALFGR